MFEHHKQPLASRSEFTRRIVRFAALAAGILSVSLGIGVLGYHFLEGLSWLYVLVNAAMILGGMGPLDPRRRPPGNGLPRSMRCIPGW